MQTRFLPIHRLLPVLAAACLLLCFPRAARPADVRTVAFTEYQIKAAFLFNFTQFIEWPTNAFTEVSAPIVIGVLGDDPFGTLLEQTVEGELVHGRKVVIKRSKHPDDLKACHLLFISRSEKGRLHQIREALRGSPVVTVSDMEQFAGRGGIIGFIIHENKVRFEINLNATEEAGVKISSKLIKLAVTVRDERQKEQS